jgi:farnesyl-diphosphate farnesyltransferase
MKNPNPQFLLGELLKNVSRSFYLTLRILPAGLREPIGVAYLLARAADTIADTQLIAPIRRLELLLSLREVVNGAEDNGQLTQIESEITQQKIHPHERTLLQSLRPVLNLLAKLGEQDGAAVRQVVKT